MDNCHICNAHLDDAEDKIGVCYDCVETFEAADLQGDRQFQEIEMLSYDPAIMELARLLGD